MKNKYGEAYIQTGVAPWDFHIKDCTCNLCKWKQPIKEREAKAYQQGVIAGLEMGLECVGEDEGDIEITQGGWPIRIVRTSITGEFKQEIRQAIQNRIQELVVGVFNLYEKTD